MPIRYTVQVLARVVFLYFVVAGVSQKLKKYCTILFCNHSMNFIVESCLIFKKEFTQSAIRIL